MKTYTIIAGVNGVGKSSFSGVLKSERNDLGCNIDVDKIAVIENCSALEAGKKAVLMINDFISRGISFLQETTLSGQKTLKTIKKARENGYIVRMFYIGLNTSEECKKRIKNRVEKGGHNIADIDVERRNKNKINDLKKILPFCDEAYFFDNENGFIEIGEYKNGELISKSEYKPKWFKQIKNKK